MSTRTADVGSIYDDVKIATATQTPFSASRRATDGVMDTPDTVSYNVATYSSHHHRFAGRDHPEHPLKNLTDQGNSHKEKLQEEFWAHTMFILPNQVRQVMFKSCPDNDATVSAPSDNTMTNSQRNLGITVHHLSEVTNHKSAG